MNLNNVYYASIADRLPELMKNLGSIQTEYALDRKHIGEAMGYLNLLMDIINTQYNNGQR